MTAEEILALIDSDDVQIGTIARSNVRRGIDWYRVSSTCITDERGNILMQRRSRSKPSHPGLWTLSCAGTVQDGESYYDNAVRELEEELGLINIELNEGPKSLPGEGMPYACQLFTAKIPSETKLVLQAEEVDRVQWFEVLVLTDLLRSQPELFVPTMPHLIALLLADEKALDQ